MRKFERIAYQVGLLSVISIASFTTLISFFLTFHTIIVMAVMNMNSTQDIKERLEKVNVVAVTCLGITSPLLTNKRFDVCIMDEAGQITLPVFFFLFSNNFGTSDNKAFKFHQFQFLEKIRLCDNTPTIEHRHYRLWPFILMLRRPTHNSVNVYSVSV